MHIYSFHSLALLCKSYGVALLKVQAFYPLDLRGTDNSFFTYTFVSNQIQAKLVY